MRQTTFAYYGLDKTKNFLHAPTCQCGCGRRVNILLTDKDVPGFIYELLEEYECDCCAIFAVKLDNTVVMGIKIDGDIEVYNCTFDGDKMELFEVFQLDMEFHCYGLVEQIGEKEYRIIMD